jgi:geranylgeranyl reductase family protein
VNEFDVIVVGGGPAGSTAATLCAQHGLSVALVEHKKFPRHKVCGDVINPNCWPVLERLGVADKVRTLPQRHMSGALFTTPSGAEIDIPTRNGYSLVAIQRSLFDACLLDHARTCGVTVFERETVHEITAERFVVTQHRRLRAVTSIIGADGRHSLVAKRSGLERTKANGHFAFQSHFRAPPAMDDRVHLHLFSGGYCGLVRIDDERVNVCLVTAPGSARWHSDPEHLFAHTVLRNPCFRNLGIVPEPLEPLQSAHPLRRGMNEPCGDGVWLVGDALRVVEPFTGQGIFFALRTAELAAESICAGRNYPDAVRMLYRHSARTNQLLRRFMYHSRTAEVAAILLTHWSAARRWLAANVLTA